LYADAAFAHLVTPVLVTRLAKLSGSDRHSQHMKPVKRLVECARTDSEDKRNVREGFDLSSNVVDVLHVHSTAVLGERKFSVGCQGRTVTLGQIVDHERDNEVCASFDLGLGVFGECGNGRYLGADVAREHDLANKLDKAMNGASYSQ
jgi:hypothetical protein